MLTKPSRVTHQKNGLLIAIEGIDGSGKSVLAKNLFAHFKQQYNVLLTKEPGGSNLGKQLRTILQENTEKIDPKAEFLLFAADRAQHFAQVIIPHLHNNYIVISDRLADSSLVYQGYGRGLDKELIHNVNAWAMNAIKPDITLYVQIDAPTALKRFNNRNTKLSRFEQEKATFFETLSAAYDALYAQRTDILFLDGKKKPEEVFDEAQTKINELLKHRTIKKL